MKLKDQPRSRDVYNVRFSTRMSRFKSLSLYLIAALSFPNLSFAADVDGTFQGGIVNLSEGSYDSIYGVQHIVDDSGGGYEQSIASDQASVSISNAQVNGLIYGGLAVIDVPFSSLRLGQAQALANSVFISQSSIEGQIFGGYAYSGANNNSGSVFAENNNVIIVSSTVSDLLVGGYTEKMSGSSDSISRANRVEVKDSRTRSLYGGYVGTTMSNEPEANTVVQNNIVDIADNSVVGSAVSHCYIMGGYVNYSQYAKNTVVSDHNSVFIQNSTTYADIYGSHVRGLMEQQAPGSTASRSTYNSVSISQSVIHLATGNGIIGAYAFDNDDSYHNPGISLELSNNSVSVLETDVFSADLVSSHIYGAYAEVKSIRESSNAFVNSNSISVQSSTATVTEIIGGFSENYFRSTSATGELGDAISNNNTVELVDSSINAERVIGGLALSYGGYASRDSSATVVTANNNTVVVDGGKVSGDIYGGYVFAEKVGDNGENIVNPYALLESNGNRIILKNTADLSEARLLGSNLQKDATTGNVLLVEGWSGTVKAVENFNKIQLTNIDWVDNGTVLQITDPNTSLSGTEIEVVSIAPASSIAEGQKMFLVHGAGDLGTTEDIVTVNQDFLSGLGLKGEGLLSVDGNGNVIYEIQQIGTSTQVQALLTNHSLASLFLNSGFDMVDYGIHTLEKENLLGRHAFAVVQGSALDYDTRKGMKINGWNAVYGFGRMFDDFGAAAFFEHGNGNYRLWNTTNAGIRRGSGDLQYQGAGIALKAKVGENLSIGSALRVGRLTNSASNILADVSGRSFGYDMKVPYVAFAAALKGNFHIGPNITARAKVAYETTWIDSEDFSIENTSFEVEHINSHQLGVGAGVDYKLSTANTLSVYLDYSYEFNAESRGSVQNVAIRSESLKGGTASADFLWNFAPDPHWDIDARMKLQTGKIEGISGLVHLGYRF